MTKFSKISIVIAIIINLSGFFLIPVKSGQAIMPAAGSAGLFVPVHDPAILINDITEWSLDEAFKIALASLKKRILDMMVDQIVQWVQGGGDPKFVSDWGGLVKDAANAAAGDFVKELGLGFLCKPFNFQIQIALSPVKKFSQRADCTLDDIVKNIDNFYADFRNGGWIAYSQVWKPQNNFYGVYLMGLDEMISRTSSAAKAAENEAVAGGGFLSTKRCVQKEVVGRGPRGEPIYGKCIKEEIVTPGKTIGDTVAKAVGADIDYIVNANDLSDYVGAIADALINRIIMEGVNGLRGASSGDAPRGGYISPAGIGQPCAGLSGALLEACRKYVQTFGQSFSFSKNGFIQQIDGTLQPRMAAKDEIKASIVILENYIKSANAIYGELAKLSVYLCRSSSGFQNDEIQRSKIMENIQNSIQQEQAILNGLRQDLIANQSIIDPLQTAKDQISKISETDWNALMAAFNTVSGKLGTLSSQNFRDSAEAEHTQITNRTAENLKTFNQQLELCQNTR